MSNVANNGWQFIFLRHLQCKYKSDKEKSDVGEYFVTDKLLEYDIKTVNFLAI